MSANDNFIAELRCFTVLMSGRSSSFAPPCSTLGGRDIITTGGMVGRLKSRYAGIGRDLLWDGEERIGDGKASPEASAPRLAVRFGSLQFALVRLAATLPPSCPRVQVSDPV